MTVEPNNADRRILVVDDDPVARDFVTLAMRFHDTDVDEAADSVAAIELIRSTEYDAVILDIDLPRCSGITLMRDIRTISDVPILILTAHDDSAICVIALESGADEFCTKPIVERELALRIDMAIERHHVQARVRSAEARAEPSGPASTAIISVGELTIDPYCRMAILDRQALDLTAKEFDLLLVLAQAPGKVFTRAELLEAVWDAKPEWQSIDTVTEHIYRLRQKIDVDETGRSWIQTLRGAGYRFDRRRAEDAEALVAEDVRSEN